MAPSASRRAASFLALLLLLLVPPSLALFGRKSKDDGGSPADTAAGGDDAVARAKRLVLSLHDHDAATGTVTAHHPPPTDVARAPAKTCDDVM